MTIRFAIGVTVLQLDQKGLFAIFAFKTFEMC